MRPSYGRRRFIPFLLTVCLLSTFLLLSRDFSLATKYAPGAAQHTEGTSFLHNEGSSANAESLSTSTTPLIQPTSTTNDVPPKARLQAKQQISFSLIMWSQPSALEGLLLLKSIIMYTSQPVDIHIVCDEEAEKTLRAGLDLVKRPRHHIRISLHKMTFQSLLDRLEREGTLQTDHSAGIPGLMKLFLHEMLPRSVGKTIYVDTDAFFVSDPSLLWNAFSRMNETTAISMGSHPDQVSPEWNHASRICSCVMLLDLDKLRSSRLMHSSLYQQAEGPDYQPALSHPAFKAMYGLPGGDGKGRYDNVRLGDQGYWWAIIQFYPQLFTPLPFDYEVTSCLMDTYMTGLGDDMRSEEEEMKKQIHVEGTPQEGTIILPKLLHFNCLSDVYMDWPGWKDPNNGLNQRWGAALAYHAGYKWIWLNQGDKDEPSHRLEISTVSNMPFADQWLLHESSRQ